MKWTVLLFSLLAIFTFTISACGGGGGGGGYNNTSNTSLQPITNSQLAGQGSTPQNPSPNPGSNAAGTAINLLPDGLVAAVIEPDEDYVIGRDSLGINGDLRFKADGTVDVLDNDSSTIVNFGGDDIVFRKNYGVDFAYMRKDIDLPPDFDGIIEKSEGVLWVGKLDYAAFGYWAHFMEGAWDDNGCREQGRIVDEGSSGSFAIVAANKVGLNNDLSFTGVAAGFAQYFNYNEESKSNQYNAMPLFGTATLSLTQSGGGGGSLALAFPDPGFSLNGSVAVDPTTGELEGPFSSFTAGDNFNLPFPRPDQDSVLSGGFGGQLYGRLDGTPSEAAGVWDAYLEWGNPYGSREGWSLDGAFGVKKEQP